MKNNWHDDVFFGIHFDWHANLSDDKIGEKLTTEYFGEFLKQIKPDWIQVDSKGHPGISSWPTAIGVAPRNLTTNHLKHCAEAARKLNIPLGVHYSGVIDYQQVKLHPDWAVENADGAKNFSSTCTAGKYVTEFMIKHIAEIVDNYSVSNIWVDGECWGAKPCWCSNCSEKFKELHGFDAPKSIEEKWWNLFMQFHRDNFFSYVKTYTDALHDKYPSLLVCSNWMYSARMPQEITVDVDYLSGDFDPVWGVARAATESRMLDCRRRDYGLSWDLMLWSFPKSYDNPAPLSRFIKPLTHMCQEASEVLAHSGAIMLYDIPERNGIIPIWKRRYYKELKEWCQKYQDNCFKTVSASNIAVLHSATHMRDFTKSQVKYCNPAQSNILFDATFACQSMEGALHFIIETGKSCDIITESSLQQLNKYQVIIIPEHVTITPDLHSSLKLYLANGGNVIYSGCNLDEATQELLGVKLFNNDLPKQYYVQQGQEALRLCEHWADVVATNTNITVIKTRLDGFSPELDKTDYPLASKKTFGKGTVIGIYGDIFREYYLSHYLPIRKFISEIFDSFNLTLNYAIAKESTRPYLELIARRKGNDLLLNIINRGASETLSSTRAILDEINPIKDIVIEFACNIEDFEINSTDGANIVKKGNRITLDFLNIYEIIKLTDFFRKTNNFITMECITQI